MNANTTTMNAVRYHGPKEPLTLEQLPIPTDEELGADDVLVHVKAAALCHTELHFCDGTLNLGVHPMTLGHEAAGIITKVGFNIDPSRIGDRVICYYYAGCTDCRWCLRGQEQLCPRLKAEYGFISDGGLAEYIRTPSRNAVVLPDTIDFVHAAPIGCSVTTAVHASKLAHVQPNDWAVVFGVNGVGFGLVQLLKNHYDARVICISRTKEKLDRALELGADAVIDGTDPSTVAAAVRDVTNGDGADVIFECVGHRQTMDACVGWTGALGRRGRLVLIGYHDGPEHDFRCHPMPLIVYEQQIIGSVGATLGDLKDAVDFVASGKVKTVVDSTIPLPDFQDGLDKIKSCDCIGKVVCVP